MLPDEAFANLMSRVQAGDALAAEELIRQFETDIRLEVRIRLRIQDSRVRHLLDSMDITQSVLGSFFAGVATGQFQPETPQQLVGLLVSMARNKLLKQVRYQRQQRRDARRLQPLGDAAGAVAGRDESPSEFVSGQELLAEFRARLSAEERELADRRHQGQTWADIAGVLGGTPHGRRKQLERAFARVARELGLEEYTSPSDPGLAAP